MIIYNNIDCVKYKKERKKNHLFCYIFIEYKLTFIKQIKR